MQHIKRPNLKGFLILILQKKLAKQYCPQLYCLFHPRENARFFLTHRKKLLTFMAFS